MTDIHTCSYQCDRPECIRAQRDELLARAEAAEARVRELEADAAKWRNYVNYRSDAEPSHVCRKCGHRYTPEAGESEDCPNCGHDGTAMQASREGR